MFAAMHAAYVMPHSVSNIAARNVLKNLQIKLKVPNIDNLFEYGYLDYDVSSDGAVISPDTSGQPSSPPSSAMSFPLGESYTSQAVRTREVSLEALGDTLIWGVRPRGIGWCGGFLWRFFSLKKIPLLLVSIVYVGAVCALPFIVRYAKRDIHPSELSTEERWLSAAYIMLVVFIGVQIMAFWVMLTEIFETQHTRMYSLSILLDPAAARTASLPVFDFSNPRHVTAWSVLYEYVAGFSETTVQFFSRRLIIFGLGLGASIAYIIGQVIYQNLSDGAFFGAFTIISFFTFAFYFVIVLIFGMRTNQFLNEFRSAIAKFELNAQLGDYVSQHFDMAHLDDEVSKEEHKNEANADSVRINDAIRLLRAVRSYLRDAPRMSIFGVDLDSYVSTIAFALLRFSVQTFESLYGLIADEFKSDL